MFPAGNHGKAWTLYDDGHADAGSDYDTKLLMMTLAVIMTVIMTAMTPFLKVSLGTAGLARATPTCVAQTILSLRQSLVPTAIRQFASFILGHVKFSSLMRHFAVSMPTFTTFPQRLVEMTVRMLSLKRKTSPLRSLRRFAIQATMHKEDNISATMRLKAATVAAMHNEKDISASKLVKVSIEATMHEEDII